MPNERLNKWREDTRQWRQGAAIAGVQSPTSNPMEGMQSMFKEHTDRIHRIMFGSGHKDLFEAILADVVDAIPFLGDASNVARVVDAAQGDGEYKKKKILLQSLDAMGGVVPEPFSALYDLFTPTNTILFLGEDFDKQTEKAGWISPLPGLPPIPPPPGFELLRRK